MSFAAVAVAVVGAAISTGINFAISSEQQDRQERAAQEAQRKALEDSRRQEYLARKAQQFADEEGKGIGTQGIVNLQVDKNVGDGTYKDTRSGLL
jgi:Na+-translocating ferredoxin:NAD+ oxidoreductase RnfG subunit